MKAWIIRWSWIGDHAEVKQPEVAILSARKSPKYVLAYVQAVHDTKTYTLKEQQELSRYNKPTPNPYSAEFVDNWQGNITCGHNPYLEAFMAENINVISDENGRETISYRRITRSEVVRSINPKSV